MTNLLDTLGLDAAQLEARKSGIGGSDANTIMSGNAERILQLWREKRGEAEPDDLSGILAVQMGSYTEPLNAAWFEKQTGQEITGRNESVQHPTIPFMRATLDGRVFDLFAEARFVWEAKHVSPHGTDEDIFNRYVPQLTHNALCDGAGGAILSAFRGNGDWLMMEYDLDEAYAEALIEAEAAFWACVQSGEPPAELPAPPPPKPRGVKVYDMAESNAWAVHAGSYIETELAAASHESAKKALKELVPDDASKCFGHGLELRRDKRGALRFYKENQDG